MNHDVIIAGAGIMGLGAAWRLASAGLRVRVLDPGPVSDATSVVAAGMLAPRAEVRPEEEDLLAFGRRSQELWPAWVDALEPFSDEGLGLRTPGTLIVAADVDDEDANAQHARWLTQLGIPHHHLDPVGLREAEPDLAPGLRGGLLVEGDGQVDNRALLVALERALHEAGGRCERGKGVARVRAVSGGVEVEDATGQVHACGHFILAAGAWSRSIRIDDLPPPPVRPVRGQLLAFDTRHRFAPRIGLRHAIHAPHVYLAHKAEGTLLAGATMEEKGFDRAVNTGALYEHLREARRLLPAIDEFPLIEIRVGFRPTSRDNRPLLGPTALPGIHFLTGHFRNGIQQAPASVDSVVAPILGHDPPADIHSFSPQRFASSQARSKK